MFWYLLIKVKPFAVDENHVFQPKTFCLDRWFAGYPKYKAISAPTTPGLGPMHFWCILIKVNNFAFDEDAVLWPKTTCLDGWCVGGRVAGFPENIAISYPN